MTCRIHPTALVAPGARLGDGVSVGPFCCIGGEVELCPGVSLDAHVVVAGRTRIGAGSVLHPFVSIGQPAQHRGYRGTSSTVEIGAGNVIREYVTVNAGTSADGTRIGDGCYLMTASHVAHDCRVGNDVVMANQATLAGHVTVEDGAIIGGLTAVHQFTRIGEQAMIGGMSAIAEDVIPFGLAVGNRATLKGLNIVGLKRRGVPRPEIHDMRAAFRRLFAEDGRFAERLEEVAEAYRDNARVMKIVAFMRGASRRGLCRPKPSHAG